MTSPEEVLFEQGDQSTDLYFVAKGGAFIHLANTAKDPLINFRRIEPGEHFGEIGVVYKCPRTATAVSDGYSTFAKMPLENYRRLVAEVPEFEGELKTFILEMYNDDLVKQWTFETLKQLPFLQDIEPDKEQVLLHKIYFRMRIKEILKGETMLRPGDQI
jgi:hypothetical protein